MIVLNSDSNQYIINLLQVFWLVYNSARSFAFTFAQSLPIRQN